MSKTKVRIFYSDRNYIDIINNEIVEIHISSLEYYKIMLKDIDNFVNDCNTKDLNAFKKDVENKKMCFENLILKKSDEGIVEIIEAFKNDVKCINFGLLRINEIKTIIDTVKFSDNIRFITRYHNGDDSNIKEMKDCFEYLQNIYDYIKAFNLSPFELSIFVYDLIRERKYQYSEEDLKNHELNDFIEDISTEELKEKARNSSFSRSLFEIYNNDSIVCAGYSRLYSVILNMFDIYTEEIGFCKDEDYGHASNIVYIDDPKYYVKLPFEVDVTWGINYNKDESVDYNSCLNNYQFFGRTIVQALFDKAQMELKPDFNDYSLIGKLLKRKNTVLRLFNLNAPKMIVEKELQMMLDSMKVIQEKIYTPEFDNIIEELEKYKSSLTEVFLGNKEKEEFNSINMKIDESLNNLFTPYDFIKALEQVRRIEHMIDSEKYPFDFDGIMITGFKKYKLKLEDAKRISGVLLFEKKLFESPTIDPKKENKKRKEILAKNPNIDFSKNPVLKKTN